VDLTTSWAIDGPDDLQPSDALAMLVDLGRLVEQAVQELKEGDEASSGFLTCPRARTRPDVLGPTTLFDSDNASIAVYGYPS
jgi:hypothetical protein